MFRVILAAFLVLVAQNFLWAGEFNWGVKYGLGTSSLHGAESDYELRYDIQQVGVVPGDFGYLKVRSRDTRSDISQQLGAYFVVPLVREHDSVSLHTELLWHRYGFRYKFADAPLATNQLLLATEFADTLKGNIDKTLDYVTLPIMLRLNQELAAEDKQNSYQGAFLYLGPSFSLLINNDTVYRDGIKALNRDVVDFAAQSQLDADLETAYTSSKVESGTDELTLLKTDFVIGAGINLKDIFKMGIGKDEFVLDLRFTTGLNDLGAVPARKAFILKSIMFSIGSRL